MTYLQIVTWLNANINTNGVAAITGAKANSAFIDYILTQLNSLTYDITRPYIIGDAVTFVDGSFTDIYSCIEAHGPGAFDVTKWVKITKRTQKLLVNDNSFNGIEVGSNIFIHSLANEDFMIYMKDASGYQIPIEIVHNTTSTQITIVSLVEYAGAKILISEI
jgi:hypothetical protein